MTAAHILKWNDIDTWSNMENGASSSLREGLKGEEAEEKRGRKGVSAARKIEMPIILWRTSHLNPTDSTYIAHNKFVNCYRLNFL